LFPQHETVSDVVYLCGNSLGLQPKSLEGEVVKSLHKWSREAVEGHFTGSDQWVEIEKQLNPPMARLVGALESEVILMNSLTCNLHLMMTSFYRPTPVRFKILVEKKAFPSDYHAVISQIQVHGFDPATALVEIEPSEGSVLVDHDRIREVIQREGSSIALILFSGIQYYTGQLFDMKSITAWGHEQGCKVGFDLAHAVGNVPLSLHDWGCDFACWCTYKYMNCGPGSMGGCFVHERHGHVGDSNSTELFFQPEPVRLAGWWGHRPSDRFHMEAKFIPSEGASGFRLSNPPVLLVACLKSSLEIFDRADIYHLREKSLCLTAYLEYLLQLHLAESVAILTPTNAMERGCQLSLKFKHIGDQGIGFEVDEILTKLKENGIYCDARKPNVIRIAPAPLYNNFQDVFRFISILRSILHSNRI